MHQTIWRCCQRALCFAAMQNRPRTSRALTGGVLLTTLLSLAPASGLAETLPPTAPAAEPPPQSSRSVLGTPSVRLQGVYRLEGDDDAARVRVEALYPPSRNLMFGVVVDWTEGSAFSDSLGGGVSLSELYVAASPANLPGLRVVAGLMDLTSYFDRNSFAKDGASHFFNLAFQTNPALGAAGLSSRVGALVNWNLTEDLEAKAVVFSARRDLADFALDSVAAEVGLRFGGESGGGMIRATYLSSEDAGRQSAFEELFQINRGGPLNPQFGPQSNDRERAFGLNSEVFFPTLKLGFFGRYGRYDNVTVGRGADTYSLGLTLLDVIADRDRLGLAYGRQLANADLRQDDTTRDVWELYYDLRLGPNLRGAIMLQERNQFTETVAGFRIKTDWDLVKGGR
jgi:hypothetical protein